MSVMIDIQLPENCLLCPVHREKGENIICPIKWSIAAFPGKGRPSWCPLTKTEASEVEYLPGDKIYHVYYEAAFPDEAVIDEQTVVDASVAGFVRTREYPDEWINAKDPFERMFRTREEAERRLEELKNIGG